MNRKIKKLLIIFFILASSFGFSTFAIIPLVPNMINNCTAGKLQGFYIPEDTLASTYNKCSILPQSIFIVTAGIGLIAVLYLLRALSILSLSIMGILLVAALFVALELLFYALFQYKYFYDSQIAVAGEDIVRNYLLTFSSLVSLTVALLVTLKLLGRKLFSSNV